MADKRKCQGTTKAGNACKSPPLKDHDFCLAHAPADVREKAGFIAANGKGGRKPNPTPLGTLRDRVEGEIDKWLAPYEEGLQAVQAVVVGNGPTATLEVVPDYKTRMRASDAVLDRIYGRPKQTTELTGEGGGPIETRELIPSDADFHTQVAQVLAEAEAVTGDS